MPITIHPRAAWAPFVDASHQAHAAAPPPASTNPNWNPVGGVFIHHRGPANPFGNDYESEDACRRDIAEIYEDHLADHDKYDGDIAYNFLICRHGRIYQGRGYERGEANSPGYIDGIGRNAGFYSILGLMRSSHTATEAMLRGFRDLIAHLRQEAARRAGTRIVPHCFESVPETECPGNLHMYAKSGSTIDPAAPWRGPADIYVYAAQRWVNSAYTSTALGYERCGETGYTGWETVLALTQGLQHELGIAPTVQNFGPGTFEAVRVRDKLPGEEFNFNLVRIYNSALWCKGYWASVELYNWTDDSRDALERIYTDAGLPYAENATRRKMWPHIVKALLRMDQFQLVPGGDTTVRRIQQRLNARYVEQVGIPAMRLVPCDGIYSRDVQQGLMMAVQYEIGIEPNAINGYFGPGTQAGLRGPGAAALSGNLRWLFRSGCLVNSPAYGPGSPPAPLEYRPADIDTDAATSTHLAWVRAFQRFSQLPETGHNDYATWAQLLVSSGDDTRPATGCDCITQITASRAQTLYSAGYRIVGRYLDEHLPPTDEDFLDKALKLGEPQTILDAGLRFFPIFQYNGTQLTNFTYPKGKDQGLIAHRKAVEHRIPAGTCIYFAVDYDALDIDIDSNIKPYFEGVRDGLHAAGDRYRFGVYGSRHVCSRVSAETGAIWSLVSGMSWGYSGNLGFPLPANWSFNQIAEYVIQPGWRLDRDVWRQGADPGVSTLDSID